MTNNSRTNNKIESVAAAGRYAIVTAEFYRDIAEQLITGAKAALGRHGIDENSIHCIRVPGAFEIPLVCKKLMEAGEHDAIIALGAVIRGETAHFDYVAGECARGVAQLNLDGGIPVIFGVLTTDTRAQAEQRAATASGDKGGAAAEAAVQMVALLRRL